MDMGDRDRNRVFVDRTRDLVLLAEPDLDPSAGRRRNALRDTLAALARKHGEEGRAVAVMRDADTRISHLTVDQIFDQGLHEFLVDFLARNGSIAQAIAQDYRFHA